jgi:adenylate cyclase
MTPNLAHAHGAKGVGLICARKHREGVASLATCIRLDPRDPLIPLRLSQVALGLYVAHDYPAAAEAAQRVIRSYPDYPASYRLSCGGGWPAWTDRGSEGGPGESGDARSELVRHVCPQPCALVIGPKTTRMWSRDCGRPAGRVDHLGLAPGRGLGLLAMERSMPRSRRSLQWVPRARPP